MNKSKAYLTTYRYDCELAFNDINGESVEIQRDYVKFIMIDHNYENNIMPIIYIKVDLTPSLYNRMVPKQGAAKIYLKLYSFRDTASTTSSSPKKVIYDEFDYYMTDDPNAYKRLNVSSEQDGTAYQECFIGLLKQDLQLKNKKTFEGVYRNTNTATLVQSATSGMKMVMQPFVNNTDLDVLICPIITTIGQFIAFLNNKHSFYNGSYMYYMDFDKTYLISNDGSYIDAKDGDFPYVAIDVRDLGQNQSLQTGVIEDSDQDAYIVFVPASDAEITIDRVSSRLVGRVTNIDSSEINQKISVANVNTSYITSIDSNPNANVIISSSDPNAASNYATRIVETTDTLTITKMEMNNKVFTPNKQYTLANYEDNPSYCGVYYLVSKQELYLRNGQSMTSQVTLTLRKCANFSKRK